jgi:hypothetical protein
MCIISNPVESVSQTKILVGPNKNLDRQITVYSNQVNNVSESNAMILPVPHPSTIEFIDLSKYKHLFTDLDKVFYKPQSRFLSKGMNFSLSANSAKLQVFNVGSYKVSLAMGLSDLNRVDGSVFNLSSGCYDLLKSSYDSTFGFIICKLAKGLENYHPFAYSHQMIKPGQLFIPTKHYHDHKRGFIYDPNNIDSSPMFSYFKQPKTNFNQEADDWSHDIYLYNCTSQQIKLMGMKSHHEYIWDGIDPFVESKNKINFDFEKLNQLEKYKIEGSHTNTDLIVNYIKKDITKNILSNSMILGY